MMFNMGFLNGLRALAAFTVLTTHCMIWSDWPGSGLPILPNADLTSRLAVDVFMILSGFLMVLNAHQRSGDEPLSRPSSWLKFYIRRFFRVAPGYYISLIAAVFLAGPFLQGYSVLAERVPMLEQSFYNGRSVEYTATNILLHLIFAFGLFPTWSSSTQLPDWSLSLEMQFYLVFPALMLIFIRFGALKVCAVLVPICMLATALWQPAFREPSLLFFKLPVFCTGMLLCYAIIVTGRWARIFLTIAAIAITGTQFYFYGRHAIWVAMAASFIAALTAKPRAKSLISSVQRWSIRLLDNKIMQVSSDFSYSVYLFHGFFIAIVGGAIFQNQVIVALNPHVRTAILFVMVLFGTIIVSAFVHWIIERPGIKAGKRIVMRLSSTATKKNLSLA